MASQIVVSYTIETEDDLEKTALQKAEIALQVVKDQAAGIRIIFDEGIIIEGTAQLDSEEPEEL